MTGACRLFINMSLVAPRTMVRFYKDLFRVRNGASIAALGQTERAVQEPRRDRWFPNVRFQSRREVREPRSITRMSLGRSASATDVRSVISKLNHRLLPEIAYAGRDTIW
jgi:hypothetical protein